MKSVYVIWNLEADTLIEMSVITEDKLDEFTEKYKARIEHVVNVVTIKDEKRIIFIAKLTDEFLLDKYKELNLSLEELKSMGYQKQAFGFEYQLIPINEDLC